MSENKKMSKAKKIFSTGKMPVPPVAEASRLCRLPKLFRTAIHDRWKT